jgi:prevent-host-death family protein
LTKSVPGRTVQRMVDVGVHEAKTHLSRLLRRVAEGEEIIITVGGRPAARLVPIGPPGLREVGFDRDILDVPDDFDLPLDPELLDSFER